MDPVTGKRGFLRNAVVRFLLLSLLLIAVRFAYVITLRGESCVSGDEFCFFNNRIGNNKLVTAAGVGHAGVSSVTLHPAGETTPEFHKRVMFYITVFQDLIVDGFLSTKSKALCVETPIGDDVYALKEIGVDDAVGIYKKAVKPLVVKGLGFRQPFGDDTFDFVFSGDGGLDRSENAGEFAAEVCRTVKPEGYFVVHTASKDTYSFNSFIALFNCCKFIRSRHIDGFGSEIHEIVMKKVNGINIKKKTEQVLSGKCSVSGYKQDLVKRAEPLIMKEPLKPWITLKKNIQNVKYLSSMVDINFKQRYVYVDVGARSYGSSIVSWFRKQYPKQNKTFDIYAVEADRHFHDQYKFKKGVTLLPYAAWVKNETLVFEINQTPGDENVEQGRGMGRIQPVKSGGGIVGSVDEIQGFDFAEWLKNTVSEKDYVVMKMDVEGTEFDLIPRLIETGAICLVDEVFLECHYNRWQKCCPGVRSPKYQKTYGQCLDLFKSLRLRGVLVHQWW
ncbi:putative methyltransferase type 11, S-adenosyl-L-methionine-dependent methyltransferase [Helianthus annuus]|nr:putative methyltransferase type 11, S-adenosyl-L-methionine-dependent methyltransferase [Helianthus annuus]KAJ0453472.1 putative methyltransferase type 11, S-adenosyl-L-methionine-dependent methyltransferase [Helianthus annuus]KAJ0647010.1 putative methyltransferase type 11, S-adenosyl-L-methionine-dependent methyltransferase [Helianthus annuus]KAJ0650908.1 putative methyltransferase type 11, S-adenosyl-L-methionine-dependent methyltransferase [Helianthus annuus]KAJ0842735.1 putative methylt